MAQLPDGTVVSGTDATTIMRRHTAGRNSTGMYIVSGIPQIKTSSGADNAGSGTLTMALDSLSREVTITCAKGTWEVWFDSAAKVAATQCITVSTGMVVTLPIRVTHVQASQLDPGNTATAEDFLSVAATLTGLDKTGYPATKGDGKLTTS